MEIYFNLIHYIGQLFVWRIHVLCWIGCWRLYLQSGCTSLMPGQKRRKHEPLACTTTLPGTNTSPQWFSFSPLWAMLISCSLSWKLWILKTLGRGDIFVRVNHHVQLLWSGECSTVLFHPWRLTDGTHNSRTRFWRSHHFDFTKIMGDL